MRLYPCYNGVMIIATADVFALVCGVFMWHTDWNWYETWYGVMLLNSVYFATYLASTSTHPNAFEWDSNQNTSSFDHQRRFSPSDNLHRYRSCNAQWSDAMAGWPSWTTVKADTSQPSLSANFGAARVKTFEFIAIVTASGDHSVTAKTEKQTTGHRWSRDGVADKAQDISLQ